MNKYLLLILFAGCTTIVCEKEELASSTSDAAASLEECNVPKIFGGDYWC